MKLNHINLLVTNVADAIKLFETYFGFKCTSIKGEHMVAMLIGADGFTLVLMAAKNDQANYPDAFHIGFILESEESVTRLYEQLQMGGVVDAHPPKKIRDSFGFYFKFENLLIEVTHLLS